MAQTEPRSIFLDFCGLLIHPIRTSAAIRAGRFSIMQMVGFLFLVGITRGGLEIPWLYLKAGASHLLVERAQRWEWYCLDSGPFLMAEISAACLRWVLFTLTAYGLARFLGGHGRLRAWLELFGAASGITVVTIAINYIYLVWDLPVIRFSVSSTFNPDIRLGQVSTSVWLAFIAYHFARAEEQLDWRASLLVGSSVPLVNNALMVAAMWGYFNIVSRWLAGPAIFRWGNLGFTLIAMALFGSSLSVIYWLTRRGR